MKSMACMCGCVALLALSSACAHKANARRGACQQAPTLATHTPGQVPGFAPWQVDRLAVPLTNALLEETASSHRVDEDRDVLTTSVALFYVAFRRSWGKFDMTRCDLHPSCSRYALEAVRHTPLWLAVPLTFARIMRDHNDPDIPRDVWGQKRDPVSHHTFMLPVYHASEQPTYDASIIWSQHVRALAQECPR